LEVTLAGSSLPVSLDEAQHATAAAHDISVRPVSWPTRSQIPFAPAVIRGLVPVLLMLDGRLGPAGAVTREIGIPDSDHDSPVFLFQVCAARPDPEVTGTGPPPPGLRFLSDPAEVGGNLGIPGAAGLIPDFGPGRIGNQGTPRAAPIPEKKCRNWGGTDHDRGLRGLTFEARPEICG
jgi:hypothetical protein